VRNGNVERRLLLGTQGWQRAEWIGSYYPADLPPEWRLAYYANDCGCVLLPAEDWCSGDLEPLRAALGEAPSSLVVFLQAPAAEAAGCDLRLLAAHDTVLLVGRYDPRFAGIPQWVARAPDLWVDGESANALVRWTVDAIDLRDLRARAERLPEATRALVLDGGGADPGRVAELRALLELMGRS